MLRRAWPVYALLVVVCILIAFTSTSFIYPDEHFQNPEIAASLVFSHGYVGDGLLETSEWTGDSPCRSIIPVFGSTGLAFTIFRAVVGTDPSARALFVAQRGMMLLFSFLSDYLVWTTSHSDLSGLVHLLALGPPAALSFTATSLLVSLSDTIYIASTFPLSPIRFILTPLNLLRYNLSSENLASHGLHPQYLHIFANWPMLFGAGLAVVWSAAMSRSEVEKQDGKKAESWRRVYLALFVIPTLLLSIQPHQEPRFLMPLIIPLVLLAPYASFFRSGRGGATLWILHTILFIVLFGYLHQSGFLPALFELNAEFRRPPSELSGTNQIDLVFWKTFMPPRHLLLPAGSTAFPAIRIIDLAGAPRSDNLEHPVLLIAPAYIVDKLALACNPSSASTENGGSTAADESMCLEAYLGGASFGVHVDMDRLGEFFSASSWERVGVGVWEVQRR
ncbi:hypothetical protein JCM8547_008293 [Rhodosporidiobolus lusitaniae]